MKLKNLLLIAILVLGSTGVFAQVAKYQPKVVAVFMGDKSPSFDESRFPDINFYYVPGMKITGNDNSNVTKKSVMSTLGVNINEATSEFEGKPEGFIYGHDGIVAFDRNGLLAGSGNLGKESDLDKLPLVIGKSMGNYEYTNLATLSKDFIKKDNSMKAGKKMKAKEPRLYDYVSFNVPDFDISDGNGNATNFNSVIKDNPLTVVVFVYLDSDFDGSKGANSSGFDETVQTVAFEKQIRSLVLIEDQIFGKSVNL